MHWERYVHPEFGFLSPTPRLRRDLRTALLSLLVGIGIGATAMIALSRNNNGDDTQGRHEVSSVSVTSEEPRKTVLGYDSPQAVGIEKRVNEDDTGKPVGSTAEANSEDRKTQAITTCEGNNPGCSNVPLPAAKPGGTQMPAAAPSEVASEHSASEKRAGDPPQSNPLADKNSSKTARNPRGYDKPVREQGRAYSFDRSFGQKGFWDWSR
jgi:hypothetical protein